MRDEAVLEFQDRPQRGHKRHALGRETGTDVVVGIVAQAKIVVAPNADRARLAQHLGRPLQRAAPLENVAQDDHAIDRFALEAIERRREEDGVFVDVGQEPVSHGSGPYDHDKSFSDCTEAVSCKDGSISVRNRLGVVRTVGPRPPRLTTSG